MEIRKLNALRGIAAIIVMISHFSNATNLWGGALGKGGGQFGVMLFFILSGFLMSLLYANKAFTLPQVYRYAVARFARVVPLFLVVVLVSFLLMKLNVTGVLYNIDSTSELLAHLLMLSGESVLWTIPAEIQFYVIFVGLWLLFSRSPKQLLYTLLVTFMLLFYIGYARPIGDVFGMKVDVSIVQSLPYFIVGTLLGHLYHYIDHFKPYQSHGVLLLLLVVPLLFPQVYQALSQQTHDLWQDTGIWLVMTLIFFAITFLLPDSNPVMSNRVGDFLGKISYSMYLLHMPVLWQIEKLGINSNALAFVLFMSAAIFVAWMSYLVIEAPAREGLRRLLAPKPNSQSLAGSKVS
ncbi:MAG: acyltransferase [Gammaproteobacteria bacterium]|nr:acyltransferase [Gammaproteobacteria bacterium]